MNRNIRILSAACAVAVASALAGCATQDPYYGAQNLSATQQTGVEYGRITNVALVSQGRNPNNNAAGAALGGVAGGLLGNQIGHGSGRAVATLLGALGGAVVGNNIAGGNRAYANTAGPVYRVSVQTDSGQLRTYDVSATGDLRPGDRVRIENGVIYLA